MEQQENLNFGQALAIVKSGRKVARSTTWASWVRIPPAPQYLSTNT